MRRAILLALPALFLALLLLLLVPLNLPARVLTLFLDGTGIELSALTGTLRRGKASRALLRTPAGYVHLGELRWRLVPLSLLRLAPELHLQSEWGGQRAELDLRLERDGLLLHDVDASFAAALAQQWLPVGLGGRVSVLVDELRIRDEWVQQLSGRVVWQRASWQASSGVRPLGDYAALLSTPSVGRIEVAVETLAGAVDVSGTGTLDRNNYATALTIRPRAGTLDTELARALSLIASPVDNGYLLRLDGAL